MKKIGIMFLLLVLLLTGCADKKSEETAPVTETRTVYFVNFGTLDGQEVAALRFVESTGTEYIDTQREEVYTLAGNIHIESFAPEQGAASSDSEIITMEPEQFRDTALLLRDNSPLLYNAELADGKIYSIRSVPGVLSSPEPVKKYCPDCGTNFSDPVVYENHACFTQPEVTATPAPTPAPSPVPAGTSGSLQCPVCALWYSEGHDYLHHQCVGYSVACPVCGSWYDAGYDFLTHGCAAPTAASTAPTTTATPKESAIPTQKPTTAATDKLCPVCAKSYTEAEYLHHQCVGYSVACPLCGNWYEAGYNFLTHSCVSQTPAPGPASSANSGDGRQQCPKCKYWYEPGFDYDTHRCAPVMDDPNGNYQQCPVCQLILPKGNKYDNHHCQGRPGKTCPDCGEYFFMLMEYDSHVCAGRQQKTQCPYCFGWFTAAEYARHEGNCPRGPKEGICPDCGGVYPPNGYSEHSFVCPVRPLVLHCNFCGKQLTSVDESGNHYSVCPVLLEQRAQAEQTPTVPELPVVPEQPVVPTEPVQQNDVQQTEPAPSVEETQPQSTQP